MTLDKDKHLFFSEFEHIITINDEKKEKKPSKLSYDIEVNEGFTDHDEYFKIYNPSKKMESQSQGNVFIKDDDL